MSSRTSFAILHFLKPGVLSVIQDTGRPGYASSGIPESGALDRASAAAANMCVGNPRTSPVLEITLAGPQIQFEGDCQIAITGAEMSPILNDISIDRYKTINVESGSLLSFGKLHSGCRTYLAVGGEWQVSRWLNSASALRIGDTDFVPGAVIQKGAKISIQVSKPQSDPQVRPTPIPTWPTIQTIRVSKGPEFSSFSTQQLVFFFNTRFRIANESNRVGYRLAEILPDYIPQTEMISSGIVPGTIQVTREGQPVILLADAQTIGGYPRIANVVSDDLDLIAQSKPGDGICFRLMKA